MAILLRRSALATLMAMALMLIAAPAFAVHKDGHPARGKASATVVTEDTDNDGMTNTPDPAGDTDNRHPSGNDRSAENGGSGNQGKADSTPDQNGKGPERDYEGTDKPGGAGGLDKLDQDGNNGCGNDDDFEDDSEGWCGGTTKPANPASSSEGDGPASSAASAQETAVSPAVFTPPTVVEGASASDDDGPVGPAGSPPEPESVFGITAVAPGSAIVDGQLAFTGVNLASLLIVISILGLLGAALLVASKRRASNKS